MTGRRISPPLFESLELLGREESLARLTQRPRLPATRGPATVARADVVPTGPHGPPAAAAPAVEPTQGPTGRAAPWPPQPQLQRYGPPPPGVSPVAATDGGPPAPGAALLPDDAPHVGLPLVETGGRHPGAGVGMFIVMPLLLLPVLAAAVALEGGSGTFGDSSRPPEPGVGHTRVDALPQPDPGLADPGVHGHRPVPPPDASALACPRCCRGCGGSSSSSASDSPSSR